MKKTPEEIEKLAFLKYPRVINDPYNPTEDDNSEDRKIWIDAYTQCQQDNSTTVTEGIKAIDFIREINEEGTSWMDDTELMATFFDEYAEIKVAEYATQCQQDNAERIKELEGEIASIYEQQAGADI